MHIDLDNELKIFILALISDNVVSADEKLVAKRLQGVLIDPKHLRTVIDFATNCGYLEAFGSQLSFTKKAHDRARHLKVHDTGLNFSDRPRAEDRTCNLTGA
jgi:hypothetical protein